MLALLGDQDKEQAPRQFLYSEAKKEEYLPHNSLAIAYPRVVSAGTMKRKR